MSGVNISTGPGPFLVSDEYEQDANGASNSQQVWEGTEAECRAKRETLRGMGAGKLNLTPTRNGAWQVRASFAFDLNGQNRSYVDVMELEVNSMMTAVEASPVFRTKFNDIQVSGHSPKAVKAMRIISDVTLKYLSGRPQIESSRTQYPQFAGKFVWVNLDGIETPFNTRELAVEAETTARFNQIPGLTPIELSRCQAMFIETAYRGTKSFIEYNHVFRRRVIAGNPSAITANMTGGGKIWTTAEVIAFEGLGSNDWFSLPPDVQWHKDKPRVLASYGQKTEISYTYTEIVTASALIYKAYGDAILLDDF